VTRQPRLPYPARWLLRWSPVTRDARPGVETDLLELFAARRRERGAIHAHRRLYHDLASLWLLRGTVPRPSRDRAVRGLLRDARDDVRFALRLFARRPAILLLTILGLSVGLGIATAAFSIMNVAVLRGEGLVDPDRVPGVLRATARSRTTAWSYEEFLRLREGSTRMQIEAVLTDTAAARIGARDEAAPTVALGFVSGGFFPVTGGRVTRGRPLEPADEPQPGPPAAVVSFVFWSSVLNRDPAVIGRTIRIGRADATIVGVAERGFSLPANRQVWMPLTAYGAVYGSGGRRTPAMGLQVFGRLRPDASLAEAEAQLGGVAAALPGDGTAPESALRVELDPHAGLGRTSAADTIAIAVFVFAVIGLVLLLACANAATVLVSAAITREREMGVRAALGASRARIVRQLITESLALGTIAAAIGLVFASWALPLIGTAVEAPAGADLAPDLMVYVFLGLVTLISGVAAGLAPARHGWGVDLVTPLKGEGARRAQLAPRRLRSLLVATQAAVSVLLIILATLFVRATFRAAAIDVGFDTAALYLVSPGLGDTFNDAAAASRTTSFWARAIPEVQAIPGIAGVALVELPPFSGITRASLTRNAPADAVIYFNRTDAAYVETLGLRILSGRTFTSAEVAANAPVVLVSESLARAYWRGQSPLGLLLPAEIPIPEIPARIIETRPVIVGVVEDAITVRLDERSRFAVYQPLPAASAGAAELLIRIAPGATGALQQAAQRLRAIDPGAEVRIASIAARVRQEAGRPRMVAALTGVVGLVAVVMCVIGLYGLTAAAVNQREREMGVRAAMGAAPGDLLGLLMWDSLRPVGFGLAIGAGAALLAGRVMAAAMLFGVSPQDPAAFAGAALILIASAILAVLVPTRRAAAVDAASVLKRA
jgi:predicted permease